MESHTVAPFAESPPMTADDLAIKIAELIGDADGAGLTAEQLIKALENAAAAIRGSDAE